MLFVITSQCIKFGVGVKRIGLTLTKVIYYIASHSVTYKVIYMPSSYLFDYYHHSDELF